MSERIQFHLDENADPSIAAGLRRYGIDVTTTKEVGLLTKSDEEQLGFICANHRVIFTQDTDFLRIASYTQTHPGIAFCQKGTRSIGEIIAGLTLIYQVFSHLPSYPVFDRSARYQLAKSFYPLHCS